MEESFSKITLGIEDSKFFRDDLNFILQKLKNNEKFSFSKYADGEFKILVNQMIQNCDGWIFDPIVDGKEQKALMDSFIFNESGYFVGISCSCCQPLKHVNWMKENVKVKDENLTWANIFVNGNYQFFVDNFIKEFSNHDVVLIAHEYSTYNNLPFKVERFIPVTMKAWKDNFDLIEKLSNEKTKDKLFLFAAGPLGNMLAHRLWKVNKKNTYLDIGSTLNPWLVGKNRGYLLGKKTVNKICVW